MCYDSTWRAVTFNALAWREWDDEIVLYDDTTGDTHHLDSLGTAVMLALLRHPEGMRVTALAGYINALFERDGVRQTAVELEPVLAELAKLKLATRCPD
jgi:PqqD family protein of HPr-rel-A system